MPTTAGAPNNALGLSFLGYPVYERLQLQHLTRADELAIVVRHAAKVVRQPVQCHRPGRLD